jgi:chromosome segregation ATPase
MSLYTKQELPDVAGELQEEFVAATSEDIVRWFKSASEEDRGAVLKEVASASYQLHVQAVSMKTAALQHAAECDNAVTDLQLSYGNACANIERLKGELAVAKASIPNGFERHLMIAAKEALGRDDDESLLDAARRAGKAVRRALSALRTHKKARKLLRDNLRRVTAELNEKDAANARMNAQYTLMEVELGDVKVMLRQLHDLLGRAGEHSSYKNMFLCVRDAIVSMLEERKNGQGEE